MSTFFIHAVSGKCHIIICKYNGLCIWIIIQKVLNLSVNEFSLAGKKVALDKSASSYYFFLTALENESSLTEDDINVIDMGDTTEAGLAFMSGSVDAAIMWEPELSEALESVNGAHALVTSADYPDTILDSLVVNSDYAKENPDVVEAVEDAWYKAVDFLNKNPDQAYEEMASGFEEVTAEDVASDVKGLKFFGKEDNEKLKTCVSHSRYFSDELDALSF